MLLSLEPKDVSIMAAVGYMMNQAGVAAVANTTGLAFLASPWGGAALTVAAMWVAEYCAMQIASFVFWRLVNVLGGTLADQSALATIGLMAGLSLALVTAPWVAVTGGFTAMIVTRFLNSDNAINLKKWTTIAALLTPFAPASLMAFMVKGLGTVAAMVPSSVATWATPTMTLLLTGTCAFLPTIKKLMRRYELNSLGNKSLPIMAATGFIMTKASVAATLANMTGVALLASPWGAAALTVAAMGMAGHLGYLVPQKILVSLALKVGAIQKRLDISDDEYQLDSSDEESSEEEHTVDSREAVCPFESHRATAGLVNESIFAGRGMIVGLGLATVVAPWVAVVGGFSAMIAERILSNNRTAEYYSDYAKGVLLLAPLAPASVTGLVARGAAAAAAMAPSAVAAWVTPTTTLLFTGVGSVGHSLKEVRSIPEAVKRWIP